MFWSIEEVISTSLMVDNTCGSTIIIYLFTLYVFYLQGDSVLKVQHITAENQKYSPDGPSDRELAKMFHTTRHPWDPKYVICTSL